MRPPSSSPDRHRDDDDECDDEDDDKTDGLSSQDDDQATRNSLYSSAVSVSLSAAAAAAAPAAACCDEDEEENKDDIDLGARSDGAVEQHRLASLALMSDARIAGDGRAIPHNVQDEPDFDDDTHSNGSLAHYFDNLHVPSDHDLNMSDSDGGAPLDDVIISTGIASSLYHLDLNLELDLDPNGDAHTDDDDDNNDNPSALVAYYSHDLPSLFSFALHGLHNVSLTMAPNLLPGAPGPSNLPADDSLVQAAPSGLAPQPPVFDNFVDTLPPVQLSNPNPNILGSENLGLVSFLRDWAHRGRLGPASRLRAPQLQEVLRQARAEVMDVTYADLVGDNCDLQGLNWTAMETTRLNARTRRRETYKNYVNCSGSDMCNRSDVTGIASRENFFRFKRINFRSNINLAHFQLRSVLACPSRVKAYYSCPSGISRINLASKTTDVVLNLREFPAMGGVITTLDAGCGVLMGGTFNGDYYLKSLDSEDGKVFSEGQISPDGITNHLRIHTTRRSSRPVASIASNDCGFRVMDIETEKFVLQTMYRFALNCSAISPDSRLRVVVGDNPDVLIVNADTGETLQKLRGHKDYGFACDWSDDGWTVATGCQDKAVKIWDARKWCNSSGVSNELCTIRCEMAGVRGLRFSPKGSGRPVLAAAEEADFINLIDARTFCSKQTIDVFSEIGGLAFANEGQELNVLCCDAHRGGLLQLERCGRGPEPLLENAWLPHAAPHPWLADRGEDTPWHDQWSHGRIPTLLGGPEPF